MGWFWLALGYMFVCGYRCQAGSLGVWVWVYGWSLVSGCVGLGVRLGVWLAVW